MRIPLETGARHRPIDCTDRDKPQFSHILIRASLRSRPLYAKMGELTVDFTGETMLIFSSSLRCCRSRRKPRKKWVKLSLSKARALNEMVICD